MALSSTLVASLRSSAGLPVTPPAPTQSGANDVLAQRKAALSGGGISTEEQKPSFMDRVGEHIKGNVKEASDSLTASGDTIGPFEAGANIFKNTMSAVASPITEALGPVIGALMEHKGGKGTIDINNNKVVNAFTDFMSKYPHFSGTLADILQGGMDEFAVAGAAEGASKLTPENIINKAGEVGDKVKGAVSDVAGKVKDAVPTSLPQNDLQIINEKITPKPTVKEARLATEQGTFQKGQPGGLIKEGTLDRIGPTDQRVKSSFTIKKYIPDAASMDEPSLYKALDEKISENAKTLQPQMESTPLKSETVQKILDDADNLHKTQLTEAKATDEPNVKKWQDNFKKIVEKNIKEEGNLNDVWNAAKEYDAGIKTNVKNATELSPEDLQTQKDVWLENRKILRDAMTDGENGLGGTAKQSFSDMRDMYEAQNGILSKAKVETTVDPSKLKKFTKSTTGKVIGGLLTGEGARKIITGSF